MHWLSFNNRIIVFCLWWSSVLWCLFVPFLKRFWFKALQGTLATKHKYFHMTSILVFDYSCFLCKVSLDLNWPKYVHLENTMFINLNNKLNQTNLYSVLRKIRLQYIKKLNIFLMPTDNKVNIFLFLLWF